MEINILVCDDEQKALKVICDELQKAAEDTGAFVKLHTCINANDVVDRLNALKDKNRDKLSSSEIDTLNDAANLISHNIKEIVRE